MGICAAVNCSNKSSKVKNITLFSLPRNDALRKQWLAKLKRENLPNDIRDCSEHFEESCFKRDLEVRFLNIYVTYPLYTRCFIFSFLYFDLSNIS